MPHREPKRGFGPFEAISITPRDDYVRSRHHTAEQAQKRLDGVPRHHDHRIVDHRPRNADGNVIGGAN